MIVTYRTASDVLLTRPQTVHPRLGEHIILMREGGVGAALSCNRCGVAGAGTGTPVLQHHGRVRCPGAGVPRTVPRIPGGDAVIPDRERDAGDIYISLASYRARRRVEDLLGKLPWLCAFRRGKGGA